MSCWYIAPNCPHSLMQVGHFFALPGDLDDSTHDANRHILGGSNNEVLDSMGRT